MKNILLALVGALLCTSAFELNGMTQEPAGNKPESVLVKRARPQEISEQGTPKQKRSFIDSDALQRALEENEAELKALLSNNMEQLPQQENDLNKLQESNYSSIKNKHLASQELISLDTFGKIIAELMTQLNKEMNSAGPEIQETYRPELSELQNFSNYVKQNTRSTVGRWIFGDAAIKRLMHEATFSGWFSMISSISKASAQRQSTSSGWFSGIRNFWKN